MRNAILLMVAAALAAGLGMRVASGQIAQSGNGPAPSFEVATIKPSVPGDMGTTFALAPGRFSANNVTLATLMGFAYHVKDDQLPKSPSWIHTEKFDVDAKVADADAEAMKKLPSNQKLDEYRLMLRKLLKERFDLILSEQKKEMAVYALVLAKNGPKAALSPVAEASLTQRTPMISGLPHGGLKAGAVSMPMLAEWLSGRADIGGRPIVDATGLTGSYDFTLDMTAVGVQSANDAAGLGNGAAGPGGATTGDAQGLSLFTALQEQLGLELESRRAPVKFLVIDHVEQPSPN